MKIIFHSNAHKLHTQRIDSPHNAVPNKFFKVDIHILIRPQKFGTIYLKDLARVLQTYVVNFICRKVQHFQADSEYLGQVGFENDMKITPIFAIIFSSKMLIRQCFTSLENTISAKMIYIVWYVLKLCWSLGKAKN